MSNLSAYSPRRRGTLSLNEANSLNNEIKIDQAATQHETCGAENNGLSHHEPVEGCRTQSLDRPGKEERGENCESFNTLVPKLRPGKALSHEIDHSHPEPVATPYYHGVVRRKGPHPELVEGCKTKSLDRLGMREENPPLNIGLFGFGCVGKGLYDVLNHSQGLKASIAKICVKDRTKPRSIPESNFTFNKHDVFRNTEHNLIVELIDDAEAALEIIGDSLAKGRGVVTANKKVLAENFELLYKLQLATGCSLLYEAACAGSIPIIRTLEEYYDNELLSSVRGILNGSSNYILSKMEFDNLSYLDALKEAQAAGFAESDPSLDVNGTDAKYKLCLLAAHAFGIIVKPEYILNLGIQNISPFDINYSAQNNCRIKLVAGIAKEGNGYRAYVLPRFVSRQSPLATINYEFNGIEVEGVYSDKQFFVGKGAGSHPTGSAVLSDISAITYNYKYGYKKLGKRDQFPRRRESQSQNGENISHTENSNQIPVGDPFMRPLQKLGDSQPNFSLDHRFITRDFTIRLYIRSHDSRSFHSLLAGLDVSSIEEEYTSSKGNYVIANVGFKSLFKLVKKPNDLFVCEV